MPGRRIDRRLVRPLLAAAVAVLPLHTALIGCAPDPAPTTCQLETNLGCEDGWRCADVDGTVGCVPAQPTQDCSLTCGEGFICARPPPMGDAACVAAPGTVESVVIDSPLEGAIVEAGPVTVRCRVQVPQLADLRLLHRPAGGDEADLPPANALSATLYAIDWDPSSAAEGRHEFACEASYGPVGWRRALRSSTATLFVDRSPPALATVETAPWLTRGPDVPLPVIASDLGSGLDTVRLGEVACAPHPTQSDRYDCPLDLSSTPAGAITDALDVILTASDRLGRQTALAAQVRVDDLPPQLSPLGIDCPDDSRDHLALQVRTTDVGSGLAPDRPADAVTGWFTLSWRDKTDVARQSDVAQRQGDTFVYKVPAEQLPAAGGDLLVSTRDVAGNMTTLALRSSCP